MSIKWKVYDFLGNLIGYFYKENDKIALESLSGKVYHVRKDLTLKQAIRILLSKDQILS